MNRIRLKGNIYQVLIAPDRVRADNDGFAELLGQWTDENIRNFSIRECDDLESALEIACDFSDLCWERLHLFHKDIYADLYRKVKTELDSNNFIYEFEPCLLKGEQIKTVMFDRVENFGNRFTLSDNMNDIISFHVINPWSKNLQEIARTLSKIPRLRIQRQSETNGVIRLIGTTDISTTYEIVLWPTIISQWAKWSSKNSHLPEKQIVLALKDAIRNQNLLDSGVGIR